ncbi:MAG: DUF488 domain-containing protein [Nitrospirota bacterium]
MNSLREQDPAQILTIGHSNHPFEAFLEMLKAHDVRLVADVRTIPKSRHNPQFNSDILGPALKAEGIGYLHLPALGGLRHRSKDSVNSGWKNDSFRGFADYMQTEGFTAGIEELIAIGQEQRTAVMCAEALPWRCHRSLIADALLVRGITVLHIMSRTSAREHALTPWAVVSGTAITYPQP